jgi:hypothetical protein
MWATVVLCMVSVYFTLSLKGLLSVCHYYTLFIFCRRQNITWPPYDRLHTTFTLDHRSFMTRMGTHWYRRDKELYYHLLIIHDNRTQMTPQNTGGASSNPSYERSSRCVGVTATYNFDLCNKINQLRRPRRRGRRIILSWIFKMWEGIVRTGWSWLRIGTGGGHFRVR